MVRTHGEQPPLLDERLELKVRCDYGARTSATSTEPRSTPAAGEFTSLACEGRLHGGVIPPECSHQAHREIVWERPSRSQSHLPDTSSGREVGRVRGTPSSRQNVTRSP